jgi:hypothetical protein
MDLKKYLKSKLISRTTTLLLYKTLVGPVSTHASETWALCKADERSLCLFERRVLIYISGAVQDKGTWRKRYNHELYKLFNEPDITKYIAMIYV